MCPLKKKYVSLALPCQKEPSFIPLKGKILMTSCHFLHFMHILSFYTVCCIPNFPNGSNGANKLRHSKSNTASVGNSNEIFLLLLEK